VELALVGDPRDSVPEDVLGIRVAPEFIQQTSEVQPRRSEVREQLELQERPRRILVREQVGRDYPDARGGPVANHRPPSRGVGIELRVWPHPKSVDRPDDLG